MEAPRISEDIDMQMELMEENYHVHDLYTSCTVPELRALFGKSSDVAGFAAALDGPRAAGIGIGITVLTGMGDDERRHREATASAIETMQLATTDIVYVSPLRDSGTVDKVENRPSEFQN